MDSTVGPFIVSADEKIIKQKAAQSKIIQITWKRDNFLFFPPLYIDLFYLFVFLSTIASTAATAVIFTMSLTELSMSVK